MMFENSEIKNPIEAKDLNSSLKFRKVYNSTSLILQSIIFQKHNNNDYYNLTVQVNTIPIYKRLLSELEVWHAIRPSMTGIGLSSDITSLTSTLRSRDLNEFESFFNILKRLDPMIVAIESELFSNILSVERNNRIEKCYPEKQRTKHVFFKLPELSAEDLIKKPLGSKSESLFEERCLKQGGMYCHSEEFEVFRTTPGLYPIIDQYKKERQSTQIFFRKKLHLNKQITALSNNPDLEKQSSTKISFDT